MLYAEGFLSAFSQGSNPLMKLAEAVAAESLVELGPPMWQGLHRVTDEAV